MNKLKKEIVTENVTSIWIIPNKFNNKEKI
jgi:hypothetical protein